MSKDGDLHSTWRTLNTLPGIARNTAAEPLVPNGQINVLAAPSPEHRLSKPEDGALRTPEDTTLKLLIEAHRFLNAQAYTQEEMEDFCKRLDDFLGIESDRTSKCCPHSITPPENCWACNPDRRNGE